MFRVRRRRKAVVTSVVPPPAPPPGRTIHNPYAPIPAERRPFTTNNDQTTEEAMRRLFMTDSVNPDHPTAHYEQTVNQY